MSTTRSHMTVDRQHKRFAAIERLEKREMLTATLAISEINYAPYKPSLSYGDTSVISSDYEFIEILNYGEAPVELDGIQLVRTNQGSGPEGVDFSFRSGTKLHPGQRLVVVEDMPAFRSRYGNDYRIAGRWIGGLENSETLTLQDAGGAIIQQFTYDSDSGWPTRAAGLGATLELKDTDLDPSDPKSWASSHMIGGTPGLSRVLVDPTIIVNEVMVHTDGSQPDVIEFHNTTDSAIDISGWYVTDNRLANPSRFYSFPQGTQIDANGYLTIDETVYNRKGNGFQLSHFNDTVWLISADSTGRPLAYQNYARLGASLDDVSVGRIVDGDPTSDMLPLSEPSLGSQNGSHLVGEVVISEVHYNPLGEDEMKEFIELQNTTDAPIRLSDWRISGAVDIDISGAVTIQPDQAIVIVGFDPSDIAVSETFRNEYGVDADVVLIGPWEGKLDNGGESITLAKPVYNGRTRHFAVVDQVDYDASEPWPIDADGAGMSIERVDLAFFGNEATSWRASRPSPGNSAPPRIIGDVNHDGVFNSSDFVLLFQNGEYEDGIPGNSTFDEGDWNGDGDFTTADFVVAFQAGTYQAT